MLLIYRSRQIAMSEKPAPQPVVTPRYANGVTQSQVDSRDLLGPHREIAIRHQDEIYRLRHTRQGKLILTK